MIFHLIAMSSFTQDLLGSQIRDIAKNRFIKHLIGLIMVYVLLLSENTSIEKAVFTTPLIYLLFLLSTKLEAQWNLALIILLVFSYSWITWREQKEIDMKNDPNMTPDMIERKRKQLDSNEYIWYASLMAITIVGGYLYFNRKQVQYGGGKFDLDMYLLGDRN